MFIPTTAAAYYGMSKQKNNAIAGLVNFVRNIGASVGTSAVTTVLARRDQFHQERVGSHITAGNAVLGDTLDGITAQLKQGGFSAHGRGERSVWARLSDVAKTGLNAFVY